MLLKKMIRDMFQNKGAYIACLTIIIIGVALYASMAVVMDSLNISKENYYINCSFADGFVKLQGIPSSEISDLNKLEGIEKIQGRFVKDVRVQIPDRENNVYLRLVSSLHDEQQTVNKISLLKGKMFTSSSKEVLVNEKFLKANELEIGDKLEVIIKGKSVELLVKGIGQTPDFIYAVRNAQDMFPDPKKFGIAYISYDTMQSLFGQSQTLNQINFTLKQGASFEKVEDELEIRLDSYGVKTIFSREDHPSHVMLSNELNSLEDTVHTIPIAFLGIAGTILYIMLKRVIEQQRGQIGIMKAFGYTKKEILIHYMTYAIVIGFIGGIVGGFCGIWLAYPMVTMYKDFFSIPGLETIFSYSYIIISILLSVVICTFSGYKGSKKVLFLQPVEAMSPKAPIKGNKTLIEKISLLWNALTTQGRMALRNVFRNKARSLFNFIGIMFAFSIIVVIMSFTNLMTFMFDHQFNKVETYDYKVSVENPINSESFKNSLYNLDGINSLETTLEIPVTLKNKWHKKDVSCLGLNKKAILYNVIDNQGNKVNIPESGIVLSKRVAELLDVNIGTQITMESAYFREDKQKVRITNIVPQYLGMNVYMYKPMLSEYIGGQTLASSALMKIDKNSFNKAKKELNKSSIIFSIKNKNEVINKYNELMESFGFMLWMFVGFAIVIGFAIVYNSCIVSLSEREREIVTLRAMGMTPKEVQQILSIEQWFISILGIIVGIPFALFLKRAMAEGMNNDFYVIPNMIDEWSFAIGIIGIVISIFIVQWAVNKKIRNLDIVEVFKDRE